MATNFCNSQFSQDPRNNPLLRDYENVSPATELTFVVSYDEEGWGVWEDFSIGMIAPLGLWGFDLWQVVGFTYDDTVIVRPYGLGAEKCIVRTIEAKPEGFAEWFAECRKERIARHKDGFVTFE